MALQAGAGFWMAQFDINLTDSDVLWANFLLGLGQSIAFTPMTVMAFSTLPPRQVTEGSAVFTLMRNFGSSLFISIAVLTLVVLLVLGMVLYFAARRSHAKPSSDPKVARIRFASLRSSFRQAVELIEGNIASRADRYGIPWIMLLNEGDDHRQLPIEQSGVASALSTESAS
eukprot:gene19018-25939_t